VASPLTPALTCPVIDFSINVTGSGSTITGGSTGSLPPPPPQLAIATEKKAINAENKILFDCRAL